jgi:hypothetical protein
VFQASTSLRRRSLEYCISSLLSAFSVSEPYTNVKFALVVCQLRFVE